MGGTGKVNTVPSLTLSSSVNGLVQRGASSILILRFEKLILREPGLDFRSNEDIGWTLRTSYL
jgi:hypothetical protein